MKSKLSTLLTSAVLSGVLAHSVAQAETKPTGTPTPDQVSDGKHKCNTPGDKVGCQNQQKPKVEEKKTDKVACKGNCGAAKSKKGM